MSRISFDISVVFMGTGEFATEVLRALNDAEFDIQCVFSRPPQKKFRGQKIEISDVHTLANSLGIDVRTPVSIHDPAERDFLVSLKPDVIVVAEYGVLISQEILDIPRIGCVNVHASLLPRWRGAAPVQRAIMAGDTQTGVCLMKMVEILDAGSVFISHTTDIAPEETYGSLYIRLARLGGMLVTTHLADIVSGTCGWVEQVGDQVVYANKIDKKECEIFWNDDAILIDRRIRGLSPKPAAWFSFLGERIRILDSVYEKDVDMSRSEGVCHGTVLDDSLLISCQRGAVRLLKLQRSGKQVLHVQDFLRGFPIKKGTILVSLG